MKLVKDFCKTLACPGETPLGYAGGKALLHRLGIFSMMKRDRNRIRAFITEAQAKEALGEFKRIHRAKFKKVS